MDEDKFGLVEKVLKDIENAMSKNDELYTFDIVPVEINFRNKSPVLYLDNCLGLESWCIKHVYMYCYSEMMDKYFSKPKRKAVKVTSVNCERLTKLLNVTLLLNPDVSSLWNKRRDMVLKSLLDKTSELRFTRLVLSRKPKCNDAFAYRRWLLDALFQDETLQTNIENLANEELHICEISADKSPNNYHSWNHRIWLMKLLKTVEKKIDINFFYIKEYEFSEIYSSKHISDYSCFHYRQFCIRNIFLIDDQHWKVLKNTINVNFRNNFIKVLVSNIPKDSTVQVSEENLLSSSDDSFINLLLYNTTKNCKCVVDNMSLCRKLEALFHDLATNNELLQFYKHHETLWYHRRFIIHEILVAMYDYFGVYRQNGNLVKNNCRKCNSDNLLQKQPKIVRYDSNNIYSSLLFIVLIFHERIFVEERRNDSDNYADRHEKYLRFVEGLNNVM